MSALFPTYARWEVNAKHGKGSILIDDKGTEYLDFVAGIAVCNLGHCHPKVTAAVEKQLGMLWHTSNLFHLDGQERVAQILTEKSVGDHVFFCNSGAEANEAAIKLARKHTGKHKIVSLNKSFHGRTLGTMAATGQAKIHDGFGPLLEGFTYVDLNSLEALDQAVSEETAAIMVEVIQGEGGIRLMSKEYAEKIEQLCKKYECLLIIDEIQTGIGRTGTAFAYEQIDLSPDIITLAKGLGNGIPVGAMIGKANLKDTFSPGSHGSTFGGNPIAMAAAEAVLTEIFQASFLETVQINGAWFKKQLQEKLTTVEIVDEIRGNGMMIGIACNIEVNPIVMACQKAGLLVLSAGPNVLRLLPPLNVTKQELEKALIILVDAITTINAEQSK